MYRSDKVRRALSVFLASTLIFGMIPKPAYAKNTEDDIKISIGESSVYDENAKKAAEIVSEMTLEQKIAQMLMPAFRYWKNGDVIDGVPELNDEMRNCIKNHGFGGTIVFAENIKGTEQTIRLIDDMQKASVSGGNLPLLVAADQEGGRVSRLATGTSMSGKS